MNNRLIDKQDPRITELLRRIEKTGRMIDKLNQTALRTLDGQRFLTDRELSQLLKISRRTLQEYRSAKLIPYYLICGKVLYKESEIQKFLEEARKQCLAEQELV